VLPPLIGRVWSAMAGRRTKVWHTKAVHTVPMTRCRIQERAVPRSPELVRLTEPGGSRSDEVREDVDREEPSVWLCVDGDEWDATAAHRGRDEC
jgi:hypothetical protein